MSLLTNTGTQSWLVGMPTHLISRLFSNSAMPSLAKLGPKAKGFVVGVELGQTSWDPMFQERRAAEIGISIFALVGDDLELFEDRMTPEMRAEIVAQLPVILQIIAAYWRDPDRQLPYIEPIRSTKVGRNEPCPCGSGKKFKKCCGGSSPATLH
jgi:uncharacterized protein